MNWTRTVQLVLFRRFSLSLLESLGVTQLLLLVDRYSSAVDTYRARIYMYMYMCTRRSPTIMVTSATLMLSASHRTSPLSLIRCARFVVVGAYRQELHGVGGTPQDHEHSTWLLRTHCMYTKTCGDENPNTNLVQQMTKLSNLVLSCLCTKNRSSSSLQSTDGSISLPTMSAATHQTIL